MKTALEASPLCQIDSPISTNDLLNILTEWNVKYTHFEHLPLRSVADAKHIQNSILPAASHDGHIKNLYMRDKRKQNYLIVVPQDREVDIKAIKTLLKTSSLSFGSPDRLMQHLGVKPGAVSPLAMINGAKSGVRLCLDKALLSYASIYMHPLVNDQTLGLSVEDFLAFVDKLNIQVTWLEL